MSTELWSTLGTIIATFVFLVIPSIAFAYLVLEIWIDDPQSYERVMAAVERDFVDAEEDEAHAAPAVAA